MTSSLREADALLRHTHYPVGLLADMLSQDNQREVDRFLRQHWSVQWVGVCHRKVLEAESARAIVAEHWCDFHTWPVDGARLAHTLGHAHGHAMLREPPRARAVAPRTMPLTGQSAAIVKLRSQIRKVANVDAPVLIWGESGSGKELTAQAIHLQSRRAEHPFVPINCGAIPPSLIQSELFGHARGAFTGATGDKIGLIESAGGGTVFLDEIADLPRELQSNLLRFLQERTIHRVGAARAIEVDARVIAASHVRLQDAVAQGRFREDLYYRLNVLPIDVPSLRERKDDLVMLAEHFFQLYCAEKAPRLKGYSDEALRAIINYEWPGNVRELINRIRRAMVMTDGRLIGPHDLDLEAALPAQRSKPLDESRLQAERAAIFASLHLIGNNVTHVARDLGISRMTLYRLMLKHGISI